MSAPARANLVSKLNDVLARPRSRHTYTTLSVLIVSTIAAKNPADALAFLQALPNTGRTMGIYWSLFSRWATDDARAAAEQAIRLPAGEGRENALQIVASTWAYQDADAALSWLNSLPPGQTRNRAVQSVMSSLASREPEKAAEIALRFPPEFFA